MPNPNVPDGVTVSRASRACYGEFSPRGQHAPTNRLLFGRELRDVGEGGDSLFDFAGIFVDEAEVVPGVGVVGEFF